jgi:benzoyl-CoA reductase subunit D
LVGGVAKNPGFVDCLKKELGVNILIPEQPEFVTAFGAAIAAAAGVVEEKVEAKVIEREKYTE